ncbi:MAG: nucleotide exchange factor GrpE [Candidatus Wolfebacteria bacterium]|nr:nucleotide exchange factor GrpE [Candidatus Wolfebacteria bacterium]
MDNDNGINSEAESDVSNEELLKCQKEKEEYLDGWKRAKAELINYKKDEIKRLEEVLKFGQESLIKEILVVLDSFDLAIISEGGEGLRLIKQQLEDVLKKNGLERIKIEAGEIFNPALHEAVSEVESDKPSGAIVEESGKGYLLNGKVVRPARVVVAK